MIDWAVITAPRPVPTLDESLKSFRQAGFDGQVSVMADGFDPSLTDENCIIQGSSKLGSLKNWQRALHILYMKNKNGFIGIFEDDVTWARQSASVLHSEINDMGSIAVSAGYLSLHLFDKHAEEIPAAKHKWRNWHVSNYGRRCAGAQCYVVPRASAKLLLKNKFFCALCDEGTMNADHAVSWSMQKMELPCWYRMPSLVNHSLGLRNSAMGHKISWDTKHWEEEARVYAV